MKPFYKSYTIWMGLLVALIPFVQAVQALPLSQTSASVISSILGVLLIINRFHTTTSIK